MISFQATEEEKSFVQVAKEIAVNDIREKARTHEEDVSIPKELVHEMNELGFLSLEEPEHLGGLELPLISQVQIQQALSYGDLGTVQGFPGLADGASLFRSLKKKQINEDYKSILDKGDKTIAFIDETNVNQLGNMSLTKSGDSYTLNGTSLPVRLGRLANHLILSVTTEDEETVIFWLDKDIHQWKVEDGDYRFGLLAANIARLSFENIVIPANQIIASGEEAINLLQKTNARIQVLQAAKQVGLMEAALDYATEYTATRQAFGQVIATYQGVSFRISRMIIATKIANHLVWEAALAIDENEEGAEGFALRAINRAHKSVTYVTDSAVQLLGGHGYVKDYPVEKWMRDAQAQVMLYGSNYAHQYGKQILTKSEKAVMT